MTTLTDRDGTALLVVDVPKDVSTARGTATAWCAASRPARRPRSRTPPTSISTEPAWPRATPR
ncbi:hypothetical protein [Microbacterium sp. Marseille-Q6648]|uniref:hypothetical protein n=1 Tax=Microbacterium sp. Marseille-Q6648 TaxID=2937991 RepID=UPI00203DF211|nr:hypothetical protein [Microbacterium sp. Marseille-Q6648]